MYAFTRETCAWIKQPVLSRTGISLPLPRFESPVHNTARLVLTVREAVRGTVGKGTKKKVLVHPGLGPKLSHSMMEGGSSGLIPDGKEICLRRKKPSTCSLSLTSCTLCTTRAAERGLTRAEYLTVRISKMNSIFKQRKKKFLRCLPAVTKPHCFFSPFPERSHLFSLK